MLKEFFDRVFFSYDQYKHVKEKVEEIWKVFSLVDDHQLKLEQQQSLNVQQTSGPPTEESTTQLFKYLASKGITRPRPLPPPLNPSK